MMKKPKKQEISDLVLRIYETVDSLESECWMYLNKWTKYRNLWIQEKQEFCESFFKTNPTLQNYDNKLRVYSDIIRELDENASYVDFGCIRYSRNQKA